MGEPTLKEIQEITEERDEALKSAMQLRIKLSEIVKAKMLFETESTNRLKELESKLSKKIRDLEKTVSKLENSLNDKINTIQSKDKYIESLKKELEGKTKSSDKINKDLNKQINELKLKTEQYNLLEHN